MSKLKNVFSFLYEEFYHYLLYIVKHPLHAFFMAVGVLAAFGSYAFATDYYVDSEVVINIAGTNYNWLEIGRYGLVFSRMLLGTSWYNPYYTGLLFLLFLWLTGMTFSYVSGKIFSKLTPIMSTLGSLIFLTYPTFSEQYYFHFQSAEIAFGLWLSTLSMGLFYLFIKEHRWSCFAISLCINVLTFSIYQSFTPLTLCGYLGIFLSFIIQKNVTDTAVRYGILGSITHFAAAFFLSQAIDKIFFPASSYLNNQVIWTNNTSLWDAFIAVIKSCLRMLIGRGIFYTPVLLFAALAAIYALYSLRKTPVLQIILTALTVIGIAVTPFMLTLLMADNTAVRSQFTYALAAVFLFYFCIEILFQKKLQFAAAVLLFVTVTQIITVQYIWKAHEYVADYDRKTSTEILKYMYDSHILNDNIAGTIFWGYLQPDSPYYDKIASSPSYLFTSVFNLEHNTEPYCFFSTNRILGYLESTGHKFVYPSMQTYRVSSFIIDREDLPAYPSEICFFNDIQAYTFNMGNSPDYYY